MMDRPTWLEVTPRDVNTEDPLKFVQKSSNYELRVRLQRAFLFIKLKSYLSLHPKCPCGHLLITNVESAMQFL